MPRSAYRIQGLRTRVFRGIKLEHRRSTSGTGNARIRGRVQKPNFFVREPKVYGTDVIFQLLSLPGSHQITLLTAGRPSTHDSAARPDLRYAEQPPA